VPEITVVAVLVMFGVGLAVGVGVEVEVGRKVGVRLGIGVAEGVKARSRVTCASTVAATSVRTGFKSTVGMLVGAGEPQAAKNSMLRNTPIAPIVFKVCAIWLFLCCCGNLRLSVRIYLY